MSNEKIRADQERVRKIISACDFNPLDPKNDGRTKAVVDGLVKSGAITLPTQKHPNK